MATLGPYLPDGAQDFGSDGWVDIGNLVYDNEGFVTTLTRTSNDSHVVSCFAWYLSTFDSIPSDATVTSIKATPRVSASHNSSTNYVQWHTSYSHLQLVDLVGTHLAYYEGVTDDKWPTSSYTSTERTLTLETSITGSMVSSGIACYPIFSIVSNGTPVVARVNTIDLTIEYTVPGWGGKRLSLASAAVAKISGVLRTGISKVSGAS